LPDYGRIAEISGTAIMKHCSPSRFYFARYFYGSQRQAAVAGT
jgi:hypothetical protein